MKLLKVLGLAMCAALASMAVVGVASASAASIETCMAKNNAECKQSATGAIALSKGKLTVSNAAINDTCEGEAKGKVVDPEAGNEKEEKEPVNWAVLENTFGAKMVNCTQGGILTVMVLSMGFHPWVGYYWYWAAVVVIHNTFLGTTCTFEAEKVGEGTWVNGNPSEFKFSGNLKKTEGSVICGATAKFSGSYKITSVTDEKLAEAGNLQIL
jgi:hypothetical protein